MHGVETLNSFKADQIIALGGGSVIDAAKIMKLKYESPRGRPRRTGRAIPGYPQARRPSTRPRRRIHARLIAISTTSGTGSEVTPFAVMIDKARAAR